MSYSATVRYVVDAETDERLTLLSVTGGGRPHVLYPEEAFELAVRLAGPDLDPRRVTTALLTAVRVACASLEAALAGSEYGELRAGASDALSVLRDAVEATPDVYR